MFPDIAETFDNMPPLRITALKKMRKDARERVGDGIVYDAAVTSAPVPIYQQW